MKTERLLELAGIKPLEEATDNFVIKHKSGEYLRADGYEKTSDISRAKIFANTGSAKRYLKNQLQNYKPEEWEVKPATVTVSEQLNEEFDHHGTDLKPLAQKVAKVLQQRVDQYMGDMDPEEKSEIEDAEHEKQIRAGITQEQGELFADMMYAAMGGPW